MRDITESKMKGSSMKSLNMFRSLCGTDSLKNVVFVTTKWDICDRKQAEGRQAEMRDKFLKAELEMGATLTSHDNSIQSACGIVRGLLGNPPVVLNIQRQLVDQKKALRDTDAFEELDKEMTLERKKWADEYAQGLKDAANEENERMKKILEESNARYKEELDRIDQQKKEMHSDEAQRKKQLADLERKVDEAASKNGQASGQFLRDMVCYWLRLGRPCANRWYYCSS